MREIKFRAWDGKRLFEISSMYLNGADQWVVEAETDNQTVNPILMQFTGLLDKNGKEIYEGDIILRDGRKEIVSWEGTGWRPFSGFSFMKGNGDPIEFGQIRIYEVIGNIYENPELVK